MTLSRAMRMLVPHTVSSEMARPISAPVSRLDGSTSKTKRDVAVAVAKMLSMVTHDAPCRRPMPATAPSTAAASE